MRRRQCWGLGLWLVVLPMAAWSQGATPTWDELQKQYSLPKDLPLAATREKLSETDNGTLFKVTYRSIHDQTVPALLFLPKQGKRPLPVVVLQHGLAGTKEQMLDDARQASLAKVGFAAFAMDAPLHGERKQPGKDLATTFFGADKTPIYQMVADLRRGVDYLGTAPEIDAHRIGYYGVSMGGYVGALAGGLDERFRASVLVVAWGDWGAFVESNEKVKQGAAAVGLSAELARQYMADADPIYFVGHISPRPLLMQNGRTDTTVPPAAAAPLHKAAKEPKEVRWYPGGHDIYADPTAIKDALEFLTKNLKEPAKS